MKFPSRGIIFMISTIKSYTLYCIHKKEKALIKKRINQNCRPIFNNTSHYKLVKGTFMSLLSSVKNEVRCEVVIQVR